MYNARQQQLPRCHGAKVYSSNTWLENIQDVYLTYDHLTNNFIHEMEILI